MTDKQTQIRRTAQLGVLFARAASVLFLATPILFGAAALMLSGRLALLGLVILVTASGFIAVSKAVPVAIKDIENKADTEEAGR